MRSSTTSTRGTRAPRAGGIPCAPAPRPISPSSSAPGSAARSATELQGGRRPPSLLRFANSLPSSVLLIEGGYGKLGARLRVRRPGSLMPEPLGSRPAEQIDPLLHELGQTAGMVRIQAVGRGLGSRVAIGLEPRFVPGQHVPDLREGKPAGHDHVPGAEGPRAGQPSKATMVAGTSQ